MVDPDCADPLGGSISAIFFGEDQGRFVVTAPKGEEVQQLGFKAKVPVKWIGTTGFVSSVENCEGIWIEDSDWFVPLTALREASDSFFRDWMEG